MTEHADAERLARKNAEILQRAWSDESFRDRLKRAPAEVMADYGIPVPEGTEIVVLEDAPGLSHMVVPPIEDVPANPATGGTGGSESESALVRALADPQARRRLVEAPRETLRSMGFAPAEGVEIAVVENAPGKTHLVLPSPPAEGEVSDEELLAASGAGFSLAIAATVLAASVSAAISGSAAGTALVSAKMADGIYKQVKG